MITYAINIETAASSHLVPRIWGFTGHDLLRIPVVAPSFPVSRGSPR